MWNLYAFNESLSLSPFVSRRPAHGHIQYEADFWFDLQQLIRMHSVVAAGPWIRVRKMRAQQIRTMCNMKNDTCDNK